VLADFARQETQTAVQMRSIAQPARQPRENDAILTNSLRQFFPTRTTETAKSVRIGAQREALSRAVSLNASPGSQDYPPAGGKAAAAGSAMTAISMKRAKSAR
jgi:hypothetical protein